MEGVGVHELVYLTKDSLDITNRMLTLKDAYDIERKIPVTRKCVELFQSAVEQTKYILQNGYNQTRQNSVNLRDSRFLIKVSVQDYIANESMITELDSVILRVIYMRLKRLAEFFFDAGTNSFCNRQARPSNKGIRIKRRLLSLLFLYEETWIRSNEQLCFFYIASNFFFCMLKYSVLGS